jgi:hypothetical protein
MFLYIFFSITTYFLNYAKNDSRTLKQALKAVAFGVVHFLAPKD